MFGLLVLIIVVSISCFVSSTYVHPCNQGVAPSVQLNNCDQSPCIINSSDILNISLTFKAPSYLENITPKVNVYNSYGFNATISKLQDACAAISNTPCPLAQNEMVRFQHSFDVKVDPLVPVTLSFKIMDEDTEEVAVCFEIDLFPFFNN